MEPREIAMSTQMQEFFSMVQQDKGLQAKLAGLCGVSREHILKTVVRVATEAGYSFTETELCGRLDSLAATAEMTPEQLDQVSGGSDKSSPRLKDPAFTGNRPLGALEQLVVYLNPPNRD